MSEEALVLSLGDKVYAATLFMAELESRGLSQRDARVMRDKLEAKGLIECFKEKKFNPKTYYGSPEAIEKLKREAARAS
jgi:hypothetical protein